jgi:hypothetical protein
MGSSFMKKTRARKSRVRVPHAYYTYSDILEYCFRFTFSIKMHVHHETRTWVCMQFVSVDIFRPYHNFFETIPVFLISLCINDGLFLIGLFYIKTLLSRSDMLTFRRLRFEKNEYLSLLNRVVTVNSSIVYQTSKTYLCSCPKKPLKKRHNFLSCTFCAQSNLRFSWSV